MKASFESLFYFIPDRINLIIKLRIFHSLVFYFLMLITSALVFSMYIKDPGIDGYYTVRYDEMIYGKAYKPFVTRALLPFTTRTIASIVPDRTKENLTLIVNEKETLSILFKKLSWKPDYAAEYLIGIMLMYISLLAFSYIIRLFLHSLYEVSDTFGRYFQIASIACLPPFFKYYSHIYDFPLLLLFTAGLLLLYKKKWNYFLLIYFISCFNKETTILLTLIFLIYFYRSREISTERYIKLFFVQLIIYIFSRALLLYIFRDNPGGVFEQHLIGHNTGLIKAYSFIALGAAGFLIFLVIHSWKKKPLILRRSIIILPILLLLALFFGFLDEYRAFYEAYPVMLLLVTYSFADLCGLKIKVKENFISNS